MPTPDDPDMTAAELALGVLDGGERAAALRRVLAEPAFAREVERWRARLEALFAEWPAAEPGPGAARRAAAIPDGTRDTGQRWRWVAALSSIAAALLLAVLVLRPSPAPISPTPVSPAPVARPAPPLIAVFTPKDGEPFGAVFDPATREVRLNGSVRTPARRVAELWAIGGDGVPHAAGLLPRDGGGRLVLARDLAIAAGTTLAISIEPIGGSPEPAPTGPVVATGKLAII